MLYYKFSLKMVLSVIKVSSGINNVENENSLKVIVGKFFKILKLYDDENNGHKYKDFMKGAIFNFLDNENKSTAAEVYKIFFEIYQITEENKSSPSNKPVSEPNLLLDIVDTMKTYEEQTGDLIESQRDHYIHSVNVFILGLCIYGENKKYQKFFNSPKNFVKYNKKYPTDNEEFFYRWGVASLFHDIAYPLEIIGKQMKKFVNDNVNIINSNKQGINTKFDFINDSEVDLTINFGNFTNFTNIPRIDSDFAKKFRKKYPTTEFIDLYNPLDILAFKISDTFGLDLFTIKKHLDNFIHDMNEQGFIDHGFFSAIIVLLAYGYLIQYYSKRNDFFFFPIVDSATAILLHNYYKNVLLKPEKFNLGKLDVETYPLAFLLILCDELQEWNRKPYGVKDKRKYNVNSCKLDFSNDKLTVTYIIENGVLSVDYPDKKENDVTSVLDIGKLFENGLEIKTKTENFDLLLMEETKKQDLKSISLTLNDIEILAKEVHKFFNKLSEEIYNDFDHTEFEDLPYDKKFSNIRFARSIPHKLGLVGLKPVPKDDPREKVEEIQEHDVEYLAIFEHDDWTIEQEIHGWKYGEPKNKEEKLRKKITPYMVQWDELDDDIKQFDYRPIKNIPKFLEKIGMKIVRTKLRTLAIIMHNFYKTKLESERIHINDFEDLPPSVQNLNFRQTYLLPEKLELIGYKLVCDDSDGKKGTLEEKDIEKLAKIEHEYWYNDHKIKGWKYGKEKDIEDKITPNMVKWDDLPENVKEDNIEIIEQLPIFLKKVGINIIKVEKKKKSKKKSKK